jgi:hypothetical protein
MLIIEYVSSIAIDYAQTKRRINTETIKGDLSDRDVTLPKLSLSYGEKSLGETSKCDSTRRLTSSLKMRVVYFRSDWPESDIQQ